MDYYKLCGVNAAPLHYCGLVPSWRHAASHAVVPGCCGRKRGSKESRKVGGEIGKCHRPLTSRSCNNRAVDVPNASPLAINTQALFADEAEGIAARQSEHVQGPRVLSLPPLT